MGHPDAVAEILNNLDILQAVIYCIREEKMAVAKQVMIQTLIYISTFEWIYSGISVCYCSQAIKSLSKLSHSKPGLDKLFHSDLLKVIKEVMATSDIIRYRVYEVRPLPRVYIFMSQALKLTLTFSLLSAGGGNLGGVPHFTRLLCQQRLHFSAPRRTDRRWCLGQVMK